MGNAVDEVEGREDETLDDGAACLRDVTEAPLDLRLWPLSASTRGCGCEADAVSGGGIDWPGLVTSDGVSVPTVVDDSSPRFRVA